jgi:hypothetical protein
LATPACEPMIALSPMLRCAGLPCKYGVFPNGNTAGNSDLRYQDRIFTYSSIMRDMDQVLHSRLKITGHKNRPGIGCIDPF